MDLHSRRRSGGMPRSARRRLAALIGKSSFSAFTLVYLSAMLPGGITRGQPLFPTPALMDRPAQFVSRNGALATTPRLPMLSGPLYPSSNSPGSFEVDAPLETGPGSANRAARYFAFRLVFRYSEEAEILFAWQRGDEPETPFQIVTGPCEGPAAVEGRRAMNETARRWTGRDGVAAYDGSTRNLLRDGRPLTWVSCEPEDREYPPVLAQQQGPPFVRSRGYVFRRFVFLIPEQVLQGGGRLLARMRDTDGSLSEPAAVPVQRAGVSVGVIGDSVAWGQGVMLPLKAGFQIYRDLINRRAIPFNSRFLMAAHSGATIRVGSNNDIADLSDEDCQRDAELHGEVPRARPTVQCQVRRLAQRTCRVANDEPGTVAVPRFYCDNDPCAPTRNFTEYKFDEGPRWDIVVATGCINDIGATDIVLGTNAAETLDSLRDEIDERCDLRNGLRDLRTWLPNAWVMFMQYHRPVTLNSNLMNTGCVSSPLQSLSEGLLQLRPDLRGLLQGELNGAAIRSEEFQQRSFEAQRAAATAMNDAAEEVGRGRVRTVDMSDLFNRFSGFMAPANATQLWPLLCTGGQVLLPVDEDRGSRPGPCSAFFNPDGDRPNNPDEESCLRASAVHPNSRANSQMAVRVRLRLMDVGMLPPPF